MKTKLILSTIGLLTLSLCSSCDSEAERQSIEAEKQYQEEVARVKAEKAEKERREQRERLATLRLKVEIEKQMIATKLNLILENHQKLSDEERSRGNALFLAFGKEYLPLLTEKCNAIFIKTLEARANFNKLVAALEAEGFDPNKDETALILGKNLRNLRVSYWTIRYKINDFYSRFKIGVITPEELAKADEELAPLY